MIRKICDVDCWPPHAHNVHTCTQCTHIYTHAHNVCTYTVYTQARIHMHTHAYIQYTHMHTVYTYTYVYNVHTKVENILIIKSSLNKFKICMYKIYSKFFKIAKNGGYFSVGKWIN